MGGCACVGAIGLLSIGLIGKLMSNIPGGEEFSHTVSDISLTSSGYLALAGTSLCALGTAVLVASCALSKKSIETPHFSFPILTKEEQILLRLQRQHIMKKHNEELAAMLRIDTSFRGRRRTSSEPSPKPPQDFTAMFHVEGKVTVYTDHFSDREKED